MSGIRAPITAAPAVGCGVPVRRSPASIPRMPSSPPVLRTRRGGCPRGCGARDSPTPLRTDRRGPRSGSATAAPTFRASATQSAIVAPSIGTKGTTSTAPMRGCSPRCERRSMSATARSKSASDRVLEAGRVADHREDRAIVRRVGGVVEQPHAGYAGGSASAIAATTSARRPSLTFGTHSIRDMKFKISDFRFQIGLTPP